MEAEIARALIDRVLHLLANKTTDMVASESSLPVERYVDPGQLERERRILFRRHPLILAPASALAAPGDFLTHDASGTPFLVHRAEDGRLHGFLNVCRHRGTRLVSEPCGHKRKGFTCPYHHWSYSSDGALFHTPHAEGFPQLAPEPKQEKGKEEVRLAPVAVEERAGLIWARAEPGVDVATHLAPIESELAQLGLGEHVAYGSGDFVRELNWKIGIEIFLEGYHLKFAHRDSIYPIFFDNVSISESRAPHYRGVFPKRSIVTLAERDRSEWNLREHANILYHIFPNTLLLVQPDHASLISLFPQSPSRTHFFHTTLIPRLPTTDKERRHWDKNIAILQQAIAEDLTLGESIQRGIPSGANQHFRLARFEHGLRYFYDATETALAAPTKD